MSRTRSTRILHVDDEQAFTELVASLLSAERETFEVIPKTDPSAALAYLEAEHVDCVVSDYEMSGMDGLELLAAVRESYPNLPFILFTGKGTEAVASEAISAGVTDYLQKAGGTEQFTILANRIENAVTQRERQRQFTTLVDNLPGIVYRTRNTPQWQSEFVRGEVEEITGYSQSALESNEVLWGELVHPDDSERLWETVQEHIETREPFEFAYRILTRDGEQKWVWERGKIVGVSDGGTEIFEGVIVDITDYKRKEQELERERERFSRLFENFPEPTASYRYEDDDPLIVSINSAFEKTFGYDADQIVGESVNDYIVPDDRLAEAREIDEQAKVAEQINRQVRRRTVDGDRYFKFRDIPIHDDEDIHGFAVYTDIHEQKEREQELEQYEQFLDHSPDLMVVVNEDGVIEYQSSVNEDVIDFKPRDLTGTVPQNHIHPDDIEAVMSNFEMLMANPDETAVTEFRGKSSADTWRWYESRARNYLEKDPINGILVSIREITERKEKEHELARQKERLDKFAGVVSHDLRNPLNVATLRVDLAASECESDHLEDVEQALTRMEQLIETLLTLARQGETVGEMQQVRLTDAVSECWENVETAGATVECRTDVSINADRSRVADLLENLFRNSVEHGGDDVTVTVGDYDDDSGIYVADDGPGISASERDRIFEGGYSTNTTGTGLGLTIVRDIAEAHGWDVRVTESDGGGARFEITGIDIVQ